MKDYLNIIEQILLIFNVIIYFKVCKHYGTNFKVFTIYLFLMLVIDIYSGYLNKRSENNLFLSHYYFLIQFVLLSYFYHNLFNKKIIKNGILITAIIVICIVSLYYLFNPAIYDKFNLFEIVLSSIPLIVFNILFLFSSLIEEKKYFYINSGIFIYLISSTLFFISGNYLDSKDRSIIYIIWIVNMINFIIYQLLVTIEWYVNFRIKKNGKIRYE